MSSAAETVRSFINLWPEGDPDRLAGFFAEDAVYHNMPMEPIHGRQAIRDTLAGFFGMVDRIEFETLHLLADGPLVMTERVDRFISAQGTIALPVMGIFEVDNGLIRAWRDYFDLQQFTSQMSPG